MQQSKSRTVKIVEVGPRDGLQGISTHVPAAVRAQLVDKLADAGLTHIEVGSFVSSKKIPAMADSDQVVKQIKRKPGVVYSALTPNMKGFEQALAVGVSEVAVFSSASEHFCQKNINCSISESFRRFEPIITAANKHNIPVRGYISCVMGCPYEGGISLKKVVEVCREMKQAGCYELSLGDTIGIGTPKKARELFNAVVGAVPVSCIAAHFHNTYGQALANLYGMVVDGLSVIDSATAGLGGCPYAPGSSGNISTEDVVYMLNGMGIKTGVDMQQLLEASDYICKYIGIESKSNTGQALAAKKQ
ncbi:MAG: hydroxymethylglutaryl-CoA lyase [Candidatus Endonucleobacter sp. (ex Gigantidas childressi)]|nr:hydroxymethylglutaryl-CoA lyase [Candidatus Endonucleobacter sp. (ex Gigantidas childressi)]